MRLGISKEVCELRSLYGKTHANKTYQMRSSRTTTNSKENGTAMIESPVSVAQRAARDSSIKPAFQDISTKFSGRFLDSLLPGGVESGWRFQRGSIDAFINGNRDFINYRLSCTIYQFQKNFACFPFRVMTLEQKSS